MEEMQNELFELQKAYNELRIQEERYRLLAENARDVIWTQKLDGTITYISPSVEQMRGLTVKEAMNQPLEKILTPDSQAISINYVMKLYSDIEAGLPLPIFRGELEYYRKDMSIVWTEVFVYPIPGSDCNSLILLGVTRDISERKQFESRLIDQTNKLKELNATKDKFFSIIAHDLISPFTGILGFSEILKSSVRDLDIESIVEYTDIINSSAQQTFTLLKNLLDWAKTQQGGIPFEPKKILINNLIATEIGLLQHRATQKNISLTNITNEDIIFAADEKMLSTIIRNLISNALKFTQRNGFVNVKAEIKSNQVEISVSDSGIGMNKETIEKLFKIETNFTNRGTDNEKGSGLGLLLCKEFVEKHGGVILVESEIGKGSRFQFSIPMKN